MKLLHHPNPQGKQGQAVGGPDILQFAFGSAAQNNRIWPDLGSGGRKSVAL
jgi:hypothetical protein